MLPVNPFQVDRAGGVATRQPQAPNNAGRAVNLTIDPDSGGFSTRVGYEPFEVGAVDWFPFDPVGPVSALHCAQAIGGGARQHILFEADGNLRLLYQAGGPDVLGTLASGRHIPTPTECGAWFTDTGYGTVITNGVDRPVIVNPWPLGSVSDLAGGISQCIRPFGFIGTPPAPSPHAVKPYPPPSGGVYPAPKIPGGGATTLWCPTQGNAIPSGRWGLGFANNVGGDDGDKEAAFGYAVSFISSTGSESPLSALGTVRWSLKADAQGFKHAVAVDIPTGPAGTVARKVYRTMNFSDDWVTPGDTSLYFLDVIRNNVDTVFFDAIPTSTATLPAPALLTSPLPAPQARFSALWGGCLWLDGGVSDPRTLYYSSPGLIEQFEATNTIELSDSGGAVTAIFAHYAVLLVFREGGIDVIQGDATAGFQASTIAVGVTCRSPKSIVAIPGFGVVFLATDGFYAVTGGLSGGSTLEILELSGELQGLTGRVTPDCLPRAVGCFAPIQREYHCYVPMDGNDRPSLGFVLHIERLQDAPQSSPWTVRDGFPVGALCTLHDGTVVFGHHTGSESGDSATQRGLFVLSGRRSLGSTLVEQTGLVPASPPVSAYRSAWNAFGDPQQQKSVSYVTLWLMSTGQPTVTVRHYKDFNNTPVVERSYVAQPPDSASLPVFDTVRLGSSTWQDKRLVSIRVSVAHLGCSWFAFEIETTEDLVLVGYELGFTMKGVATIQGVRA